MNMQAQFIGKNKRDTLNRERAAQKHSLASDLFALIATASLVGAASILLPALV
jgi:hypothetical protein